MKRKAICYLEISIMIVSLFAIAFIIADGNKFIESALEKELDKNPELRKALEQKKTSIFDIASNLFSDWMKRSQLGVVSAVEQTNTVSFDAANLDAYTLNCCPKLKNNAICQDLAKISCADSCAVSCLPTKCTEVTSCKPGCCIDKKEGICESGAGKASCESEGGLWKDDVSCNVAECSLGCCVIGRDTQFVTESRCKRLSAFNGLVTDFRKDIQAEIDCLILSNSQTEGACVYSGGCKIITKSECGKLSGEFHNGYLCSNPQLNTDCTRQVSKACYEDAQEVYWFDSCGNRENIWSSDKDSSWNNGKLLGKEESCNPDSPNINSNSCGNCNYFEGSICKSGKCQDLNCYNAPDSVGTKNRKNGESWCVYESFIGDGKDTVGSRHYKYYCIDGEVRSEPCADYRKGICVESEEIISSAACKPNSAIECINYNNQKDPKGKPDNAKIAKDCKANSDCTMRSMNFGKGYEFNVCVPKYPLGFDLVKNSAGAETMCNQADFTCTKIMEKKISGWSCIAGCDCDKLSFTQQMNEWCISMGDCGGKANLNGKVTADGYSVSKAPELNILDYAKYAKPVEGQRAEPGNVTAYLASKYGWGASSVNPNKPDDMDYTMAVLGSVAGGLGVAYISFALGMTATTGSAVGVTGAAAGIFSGSTTLTTAGSGIGYSTTSGTGATALSGTGTMSTAAAGIGSAAIMAAIGIAAGYIVAKLLGLEGQGMLITIMAGALAGIGVVVAAAWLGYGWSACIATGPGFLICVIIVLIVVIIVAVLMKVLGIGETKKTKVIFNCAVWEAPPKGEDCAKCGNNPLKPCTEYRCKSLGQQCEFINKGTGNEICYWDNSQDVTSARISPWKEIITPGYSYISIKTDGFKLATKSGGCLQEFSPVVFGISTNKPTQCRIAYEHTTDFDKMDDYVGESSLYKYNHSIGFSMPSVESMLTDLSDSLNASQLANLKSLAIKTYGNLTMYIRCRDKSGNYNLKEYMVKTCVNAGPDKTPPYVVKSNPEESAWIAYGKNSSLMTVWVNEPADCKYSFFEEPYSKMNKTMSCIVGVTENDIYGWKCSAELDSLVRSENKVYIRCLDQPTLPENNSSRNAMQNSYELSFKKSQSKLKILSVNPNGTVFSGQEPATVILEVATEGGVDGTAGCEYSFTGYDDTTAMYNTGRTIHTQEFNRLLRGDYTIYVKCIDVAGNEARAKTNLNLVIDDIAPKVLRVYNLGGRLNVITDENSSCSYSDKSCGFEFVNGTIMTGLDTTHFAESSVNSMYYIKCKDSYGNYPGECSIIVKLTDLGVAQ